MPHESIENSPFVTSTTIDAFESEQCGIDVDTPGILSTLVFTDIYLGKDPAKALLGGIPNTADPVTVDVACVEELIGLRNICVAKINSAQMQTGDSSVSLNVSSEMIRNGFAIRFGGITYRVTIMQSLHDNVFVLRRFPDHVLSFNELKIPAAYQKRFLTPALKGLIVIAGGYRNGKTHTAAAVVKERLSCFGGVAITAEDPPEMPLEGMHNNMGQCWQTWVGQNGYKDFAESCKQLSRCTPSIIYIGEIRDQDAAIEALRAALTGSLVICTLHGVNIIAAIRRLLAFATSECGSEEEACDLIANALACVAHQELTNDGPSGGKLLKMRFLWVAGDDGMQVRSVIQGRQLQSLGDVITRQLNLSLTKPGL